MTNRVIDLTKLPEEILVDLINKDNGTALTSALIGFKTPSALPEHAARNTEITVFAKRGSGMKGEVKVWYNRLNLAEIVGKTDPVFDLKDARRVSDLIPEINQRFGIHLTSLDFVDADLPSTTGGFGNTYPITFNAAPLSLVYIGEAGFIIRTKDLEGILLSSVITDRVLNLFTYTPPP